MLTMQKILENHKQKPYSKYKKSRDENLELSSLTNLYDSIRDKYSVIVGLYDIAPKYVYNNVEKLRTSDGLLKPITRDFVFKKQKMPLTISPAIIETNGVEQAFYPSTREEIVESVLRKFATNPNKNEFLDDSLSVRFTLYDLWKELKKTGHLYNYDSIKESLQILAKTKLEIVNENKEVIFSSYMLETFGVVDCNDVEDKN